MRRYKEELLPLLEKLPVPELNDTMRELEEWVAPFLTDFEQEEFKQLVERFQTEDGLQLQERLQGHWQQTEDSWLADFWQDSYLGGRGCVQSETNFGLVIREEHHAQAFSRAEKAAQLIYQLTNVHLALEEGSFPLEYTRNGQHLDMSYYGNLFGSCRIAGLEKDSFFKSEEKNSHILVLNRGSYYQLNVIDQSGNPYSVKNILEAIHYILAEEQSADDGEKNLAYLTGVERETAHLVYQQLIEIEGNQRNCELLENALFVVSFTDGEDNCPENRVSTMLLNGQDQIFTKTIQALITKNGTIGFNIEHTAVDGVPTMNILAQAFADFGSEPLAASEEQAASLVHRLSWQFTPKLLEALVQCRLAVEEEAKAYHIYHRVIEGLGKNKLKELRISPDAYFHVALAVAQKDVFGRLESVYEPVAMRSFYGGRTECARSLSQEKKKFSEAFLNQEKPREPAELADLFQQAISAHSNRLVRCQKGLGVERHLFGLEKMADESLNAAYFFESKGVKKLTRNFVSTTGIPSELLESFSFCPVDSEGFGLYYGILENRIVLTLSSGKERMYEGEQLIQKLEYYLLALMDIVK